MEWVKGAAMARWGVAILAIGLVATPGRAETLTLLGTSESGAEIRVDRDSLRGVQPDGDLRKFAAVQLRAVIQSPGGRRSGTVTERALYSFNCTNRTLTVLAYTKSAAYRVRSHDWVGADIAVRYEPVKPGSLAEMALIYACNGGKMPEAPKKGTDAPTTGDEGQ
jgi:hypothetical protein